MANYRCHPKSFGIDNEEKHDSAPVKLEEIKVNSDNPFGDKDTKPKGEALNIWGKIILKLRENNNFILHAICGGISNVTILNDNLIIGSDNEIELDTINENTDSLNAILEELGYNYTVLTNFIESPRVVNSNNIKLLKSIFGDDLIVE